MAALDGVECAVALDNEVAGIITPQPRHQRASVRGATRSDSGSRRAGVAGVLIAGEIGQGGTRSERSSCDNDARQGVQQARELLTPVYGCFTEGFDTRDLKEPKALLQELAT